MISLEQPEKAVVRIRIIGVGGGGTNAVERMMDADIPLVDYVTVNTDDGGYQGSRAHTKLQIGLGETKGRGAGGDPQKGLRAAQENRRDVENAISDCDMLFIAAGMGGGTGTGAAPVVAEIAKRLGILTVAVVTTPFSFEGRRRMEHALNGIARLRENVDSIIIIPNDNLKLVTQTKITLKNAFSLADDVLVRTVKNIVGVIQRTAFINCDFADITSIVKDSGAMHAATGEANGPDRVSEVVEQIRSSVLLGSSVEGATGIMLCVTASEGVGLEEIDRITSAVTDLAAPDANIIFGMDFDAEMGDRLRAVLIATKKGGNRRL